VRVVLDTNVLLSAAFFPGVCEKVLAHCFLTPSVQVVLSEHILGEFVEHGLGKLRRMDAKARRYCRWSSRHNQFVGPRSTRSP
jgi:predicted nucleic acid-binding protein